MCDFSTSDSWVILSPIEQSIKRKIEAVGTPLKDWDIQINYGIKTGCNGAFIISTEKRKEILNNCQTEDERKRTDELIRPFLYSFLSKEMVFFLLLEKEYLYFESCQVIIYILTDPHNRTNIFE